MAATLLPRRCVVWLFALLLVNVTGLAAESDGAEPTMDPALVGTWGFPGSPRGTTWTFEDDGTVEVTNYTTYDPSKPLDGTFHLEITAPGRGLLSSDDGTATYRFGYRFDGSDLMLWLEGGQGFDFLPRAK